MLTIRRVNMEASDFNVFVQLEQEFARYYEAAGVGTHYGRVPAEQIPMSDHWLEFLNGFRENSIFIYAEDRGSVFGYLMGSIEDMPSGYRESKVGFLDSLFVLPGSRFEGIGTALRDHFLQWLKSQNIRFCQLTVKTENCLARGFWERSGFTADEIRMWKEI